MKPAAFWLTCLLTACGGLPDGPPEVSANSAIDSVPVQMQALPGQLNNEVLLHSNNPERIESPGVLLSTLSGQGPMLNQALEGRFSLFLHHLARTQALDGRKIWIGLLAQNSADKPARLQLIQGNAFLTGPDAPFLSQPVLQANDESKIYSGPGDRTALATLRGESSIKPQSWELPASSQTLLSQWQIATNPLFFFQQDNALSALLRFSASNPVRLSLVALLQNDRPAQKDFETMLATGQPAGPAEPAATAYDPAKAAPAGVFRYGRVAGLTQGSQWQGELEIQADGPDNRGFPISALYARPFGTGQNQSAPVLARVPGSAYESHGNFGVHYRLNLKLNNPSSRVRELAIALQHPLTVDKNLARFRQSPGPAIKFRGSLHLQLAELDKWFHLVLHEGEKSAPFIRLELAPQSQQTGQLEWVYPADSTPPQLLQFKFTD